MATYELPPQPESGTAWTVDPKTGQPQEWRRDRRRDGRPDDAWSTVDGKFDLRTWAGLLGLGPVTDERPVVAEPKVTVDLGRLAEIKHLAPLSSAGTRSLLGAVAYVTHQQYGDIPKRVSPLLTTLGETLGRRLDAERRDGLIPLIPLLVNTADDGLENQRGYLMLDWLVRTWLPAWLELLTPLPAPVSIAERLRLLDPIDASTLSVPSVREGISAAKRAAGGATDAVSDELAGTDVSARTVADIIGRGLIQDRDQIVVAAASLARCDCELPGALDAFTAGTHARRASAWYAPRAELVATTTVLSRSVVDLFERMARVGR